MPRRVPPLTDIQCRNAKPRDKNYHLTDGDGLRLIVSKTSKLWRMKYRFQGKEGLASFGPYPTISLNQAREKRREIQEMISRGIDPAAAKRESKQQRPNNTFEQIARDWHQKQSNRWKPHHAAKVISSLEKEVFPTLGRLDPTTIEPRDILNLVRSLEDRGSYELASRILQRISNIFTYGMVIGGCKHNPAAGLSQGLTKRKPKEFSFLDHTEVPLFMRKLAEYPGDRTTVLGLKLLIHTFLRSSEIRLGKWEEIDWENNLWRIPAVRMKKPRDHLVPLTQQSLSLLQQLHQSSGRFDLILPSRNNFNKPLSENTFTKVIKKLGFEATAHGFRKTASTWCNEQGFHADAIERQLAHVPANAIRGIYNKAEYLDERYKMMAAWSNFVEGPLTKESNQCNIAPSTLIQPA